MIRIAAALALSLAALPVSAQQVDWRTLGEALHDTRPQGPEMSSGTQAVLRALDKVSGDVEDLPVDVGATTSYGRLTIALTACRFPTENPASDAFAFLQITDNIGAESVFRGWMIASSPALNALDHPRYDVWVLSCS
ncbi:DUF2155 domain-containing protein [Pararhodobacter zhoushanensis]|uniref:DUF2155 domain-containing protein n=1 Tax=Pararhodobacter zhoushanensis TaxID=2479545 RepID=UPI000F8F060E|nr:DUF2155 domain-containing protein [Pararhodobacter zhoushanensis]